MLFYIESVTEGLPDKICDKISGRDTRRTPAAGSLVARGRVKPL
jgi:hypothetical protein